MSKLIVCSDFILNAWLETDYRPGKHKFSKYDGLHATLFTQVAQHILYSLFKGILLLPPRVIF